MKIIFHLRKAALSAGCLIASVCAADPLHGQEVVKANNTDALSVGSSWIGGTVPTASNVLVWNSTVTGTNTVSLGGDLAVSGIKIVNPGGPITISSGSTLSIGASGIDMTTATKNLNIAGQVNLSANQIWDVRLNYVLDSNGNTNSGGISVITQGYTLTVQGAGATQLGTVSGSGDIVKNGTGNLLFESNSSYTGDIAVYGGQFIAGSDGSVFGSGAATLTLYGGTTAAKANGPRAYGRAVTVAGNAAFYNNNSGNTGAQSYAFGTLSIGEHTFSVTANGSGTGTLTFGSTTLTGNATFDVGSRATNFLVLGAVGESGGARGLTKSGVGTLNITGASTYTGTTSISGGILALTGTGAISASSQIVNDGTLDITAITTASTTIGRLSGAGSVLIGGKTLTLGGSGDASFSGTITGSAGGIIKQGEGFQTLAGANVYNGNTTISQGGLVITSTGALPGWNTAGRYSVANGATLAVGSAVADADVTTLLGTGNFAAGSRIGFDTSAGNRTYGDVIADTGNGALGLAKVGTGTLTLSGSNTFTGATAVSAGKLLVNGALANTTGVTVAGDAVLGGSGSINGLTTVGGTLSPGNSPGILTFDSLLLSSSATTLIEIAAAGVRGTDYDGINVLDTNGLTYGGTLTFAFGGSVLADNSLFSIFNLASGTPAGSFATLTSTGFYDGSWSSVGGGQWQSSKGSQTLTFSQSTGQLVIVPEPGALSLAALGCAAVGWTMCRRRRAVIPSHS